MNKRKSREIKKAVALSYKNQDNVPKILAKGEGTIAENIVKKGEEEDIVIYEDENLIDSLINLDINQEIPEELYEAVAEIILFVYTLDKEKEDENGK
ncbi:EscU/YscU/HrcU family type III secretion system export apparatus switch protein [Tissierella sp. MSJ-40]|uniref:EscU/YscU/HrcU family type III secretion system export apparatus switch protein n=1 Tax=Tissierella simiarum TaxID=2841534 RepID=A0ABS6E672_9FIRM|nr:EscU/YscU/HrcU family type III secretion system export apparatus switch protein [Tissierella simiarum]MBU5437723.1 EscU/YscU/HrcU family type III secretion system export apparatus switch protein [Tissierella simiarum]